MVATHAEGYSPIDLKDLITRTMQQGASRAFLKHGAGATEVRISMDCCYRSNRYARSFYLAPISRTRKWISFLNPCAMSLSRNRMWSGLTSEVSLVFLPSVILTVDRCPRTKTCQTHPARNIGMAHQVRPIVQAVTLALAFRVSWKTCYPCTVIYVEIGCCFMVTPVVGRRLLLPPWPKSVG